MTLIRTSWYLCILLFLTSTVGSAISVAPSAQHMWNVTLLVILALSIISGIAAIALWRTHKTKPESKLFKSKILARAYVSLVVILTLLSVFGVIG